MITKRDMATTANLVIMNSLGENFIKPSMMEDFEQQSISDYISFVKEKIKEHSIHALVSIAWAKTKFIFGKQKKIYDYLNSNNNDSGLFMIWMPEIFGFIITDSKESYSKILSKNPYKEMSDLFIRDILEMENAIEIEYINRNSIVNFEEKPLSVQEDEEELLNYS